MEQYVEKNYFLNFLPFSYLELVLNSTLHGWTFMVPLWCGLSLTAAICALSRAAPTASTVPREDFQSSGSHGPKVGDMDNISKKVALFFFFFVLQMEPCFSRICVVRLIPMGRYPLAEWLKVKRRESTNVWQQIDTGKRRTQRPSFKLSVGQFYFDFFFFFFCKMAVNHK